MNDRDMMYGGFFQNCPGNIQYGNFGFQTGPGSLLGNGMMPNMMNGYQSSSFDLMSNNDNSYIMELNSKFMELEKRINNLEQSVYGTDSFKDDNSMYMI